MQQKVQFAGALLHDPDLVILDEPFSGLDPVNSQVMKDVVVDIARSGRTVLFSTHIMEQAERMCDRIVIIARGKKVVDGAVADVKREFGGRHVALSFTHDKEKASRILLDRRLIGKVDDYGATAEVEMADGANPETLLQLLVRGASFSRFEGSSHPCVDLHRQGGRRIARTAQRRPRTTGQSAAVGTELVAEFGGHVISSGS